VTHEREKPDPESSAIAVGRRAGRGCRPGQRDNRRSDPGYGQNQAPTQRAWGRPMPNIGVITVKAKGRTASATVCNSASTTGGRLAACKDGPVDGENHLSVKGIRGLFPGPGGSCRETL
jgi:hypothetical protein